MNLPSFAERLNRVINNINTNTGTIVENPRENERNICKPPFTYAELTALALIDNQYRPLKLHEVFHFIQEMFLHFKTAGYHKWASLKRRIKETIWADRRFVIVRQEFQLLNGKYI